MDEMIIKSKVITAVLSNVISMLLKKQVGITCEIKIHEVSFHNTGDKTNIKLDLEGNLPTSEIPKLVHMFSHQNPIL